MSKAQKTLGSFIGSLLVAMPHMEDERFHQSVIYVCGHDENGAMGLVINKLIETVTLKTLLDQLGVDIPDSDVDMQVHYGGPVEVGRGFVLHTADYHHESSISVNADYALTATIDVLKDIALGRGPRNSLLALGYVGWSAGQLEEEILQNSWLQVDADETLLFSKSVGSRWYDAISKLGVDPDMLSSESGHA